MKFSLRFNLFGAAMVTAFVLLAGTMAVAHPTGFFGDFPDCGSSGSPSNAPSAQPSPSSSGEPCPSESGSGEPSGNPSGSGSPGPSTGAIAGRFTSDSGAPLRSAQVSAQLVLGGPVHQVTTDHDGRYRISKLTPGNYRVSFHIPGTSLVEYAHRKKLAELANPITVTAKHTTTVDEQALPVGTVTGHLRDRAGHPVAAQVAVLSSTGDDRLSQFTQTDGTGAFTTHVFGGTYTVRFSYGELRQYAVQQVDSTLAKKYHVGSASPTVITETTVPTGVIAGRITERDGSPAFGAQVILTPLTSNDLRLTSTTGPDGRYRLDPVPVGTYRIQLVSPQQDRRQWVNHTVDDRQAASITVSTDQTTTVNDQFLATGTVRVTATDPAGQPIFGFCARVSGGGNGQASCDSGGTAVITDVPAGSYTLFVGGFTDSTLPTTLRGVPVVAGQTTARTVVLQPSATILTTALDAHTHQPAANICVDAVSPGGQRLPSQRGCSDANGTVRITGLVAGSYVLLAYAFDGVHGDQWVGPSGGTGDKALARPVTIQAGQVSTVAPILLDRPGSVTGTVTDRVTGKAVPNVCVTAIPIGVRDNFGGGCEGAFTDDTGHYRLDGLGPYGWPLEYAADARSPYPWQWSGGAPSRKQATLVPVHAGATVTANAGLATGTTVGGKVVDGHGVPLSSRVAVVNTDTGDLVANPAYGFGRYQVRAAAQTVRLQYSELFGIAPVFWYHNTADFTHATPVPVGTSPVTVDLVVP